MGLSVWQLKRQLSWLASRAAWTDSPAGLVFTGGAFASEDLEANFQIGSAQIDGPLAKTGVSNAAGVTPFCRVTNLRSEWDRRSCSSRLDSASFRLWATAGGGAVPGTPSQTGFDTHGINQVTGVNRDTTNFGLGASQGRDVDELISQMVVANGGYFIDSTHGFQGRCMQCEMMAPVNGVMVLKRGVEIEVVNPLQANYYHNARLFAGALAAGPTVNLSWTLPPLRFDSIYQMIRRGTASGDPAPTTPGALDGTFVWSGMPNVAAAGTAHPGTGTWNYALFTIYAESPRGWPTIEVLLTTQPVGSSIVVVTTAGEFTVDTSAVNAATLADAATAIAALVNASAAATYTTATASGPYVILQPLDTPAWLGVRRNSLGLNRTNGDHIQRTTCTVVLA